MRMWHYRGDSPNFGDELNSWLWPKVLGEAFDGDGSSLFLGIGSIIFNDFPANVRKHVFGAGYGGYTATPDLHDGSWTVQFVRGPQTARRLQLAPKLALADPAILVRLAAPMEPVAGHEVSFMPHWQSMQRGHWDIACKLAGITLIDPRRPVDEVLGLMRGSRLLIAEAMHGAIVADALRIPWIAARPTCPEHRMKWIDWAQSLGIALRPLRLWPSSAPELRLTLARHRGERTVIPASQHVLDQSIAHLAAWRLRWLSKQEPSLSADSQIIRATERLQQELLRFQRMNAR